MSCYCHGKKGEAKSGRVRPDDQCTMCAYKHLLMACGAYSELSYEEDNREWVAGQLRLAVEHLKLEHREFALEIRDLAVMVEMAKDESRANFIARLNDSGRRVRELMHNDHPDVSERLSTVRKTHERIRPCVVIPLGSGSQTGDDELKILLRSIETNLVGAGQIFIVTHTPPEWLNRDEVTVVDIADRYTDNKDANLHLKVLETARKHGFNHFIFCADDNCFMQKVRAAEIPVLRNHRPREAFEGGGRWRERVRHTFDWAESLGVKLDFNFECHAPQVFDAKKVLAGMENVDCVSPPGLTIYTAWRVVSDSWRDSLPQVDYKITLEACTAEDVASMKDSYLTSRMFLGYNDVAVGAGIIARLRQIFPHKSRFEK